MATPGPGNTVTIRISTPPRTTATGEIVAAVTAEAGVVTGLTVLESDHRGLVIEVDCDTTGSEHAHRITETLARLDGAEVQDVDDLTFSMHAGGKLEVVPQTMLHSPEELARAYTPGVARVCLAIADEPARARDLTIKGNTVAVVTDGSAVLGLGNIGPAAALPVMEGKAALFKQFADVDAWPVCLDTQDVDEIVSIVRALAPVYGGINLEDIAAPRCFEIERRLRAELDIPVFHDDQHGTAIVTLAALRNALKVVGKKLPDVRVVVAGAGAAGTAIISLLLAEGAHDVIACDRSGAISSTRPDLEGYRAQLAADTNPRNFAGTIKEALVGADVFIGVSGPNVIDDSDVAAMASDAIVFAMANPTPEIDPAIAARHAAVVATGRSDFPNQINNVLAFPGIFRGLLDAHASEITTTMLVAAAKAISDRVPAEKLSATFIVPSVFDEQVGQDVANAVMAAAR